MMTDLPFGLTEHERALISGVLSRHPEIARAVIFGSRAKGNYRPNSDIDVAVWGDLVNGTLARLAGELEELRLPYLFDVQRYEAIAHPALKEHIDLVGKEIYARRTA
ncbi:MAG: nucleotidyltransferase domain-containing protein [Alphaproteobacteria bacterium]